jgi:hypothetical protein
MKFSYLFAIPTALALAAIAAPASATTVDFVFDEGGSTVATGEFSYAGSGVLHYADLSAFSITVAGVPYDLAFADASTNYSYFAYDTTSNSFVAGQGTGDYGQLDELLGAYAEPITSGNYFKPPPVNQFTEITTSTYDQPYTSVTLTPKGVPEPSTLVLFGASLIGLGFLRRRKVALQSPVKAYV